MHPFHYMITTIRNHFARHNRLSSAINHVTDQIRKPLVDGYRTTPAPIKQPPMVIENVSDGVIICDEQDHILRLNKAARTLLNLQPGQPVPTYFRDIPLTKLTCQNPMNPEVYRINQEIVHVSVSPFQNDDGIAFGRVYLLRDLTDTVGIDQARTSFIATISHELRTPLMVLSGNTDLLIRGCIGPLTSEQHVLMQSMRNHTQRMTTLVNNVITLAELESGALTVDLTPLPLTQIIDEVTKSIQHILAARDITISLEVAPELPLVLADHHQLVIVLQQLLDNAQRYTQHGHVTIQTSFDQRHVRVDIADTGCGIAPDAIATLFTRFSRSVERISSADRGFGLGLAIARELIERQGGQIWLAETSARGSVFSFTIPCTQVPEQLTPTRCRTVTA
jgi:signal transduction histidine kinase